MTDDDIDYSDIPALTDEELAKFKPARLRKQKQNIASWTTQKISLVEMSGDFLLRGVNKWYKIPRVETFSDKVFTRRVF